MKQLYSYKLSSGGIIEIYYTGIWKSRLNCDFYYIIYYKGLTITINIKYKKDTHPLDMILASQIDRLL